MDEHSSDSFPPHEHEGPLPEADWREALKAELGRWIEALPEPPPEPAAADASEAVGLPRVWETLIALEAHTRTHARKTVAALEGFSGEIAALRGQLAARAAGEPDPLAAVRGMAEVNAQLRRMREVLAAPPPPAAFGLSRRWEDAWKSVDRGAGMLHRSFESVLRGQGIRTEWPETGTPFDPASMEAVEVVAGSGEGVGVVLETVEPAYHSASGLLRPAKVRVER